MPFLAESDLRLLGKAKMESDRRNYGAKKDIIRRLIFQAPQNFAVDSQQDGISGITHTPTMFRLHMPSNAVPPAIRPPVSAIASGEGSPAPKQAEFNMPGHITTTAIGGLLGTGLGYGAGALIEGSLPPGYIEKHKLRNRLAILGGAAGVAPGIWAATRDGRANVEQGKSYWGGFLGRDQMLGAEAPPAAPSPLKEARARLHADFDMEPTDFALSKEADAFFEPLVHADQFNRAVIEDPLSPLPLKLTTMSIVDQASQMRQSPWVSPADIAHVAIGMGSGLAAGTTLGKVVGVLAGLTPEAQTSLQQVGMWYGAIRGAMSN